MQPAQPSRVGGTSTTLINVFDLDPQTHNKFFKSRGDQGLGYMETLRSLGFELPVSGLKYFWFEEDWIRQYVVVGTIVTASSGAGTACVFKLNRFEF